MTVVDVNTGKFVGSGGNLEETVTNNNIEAAEEVVRQLRLRDIGGIIVIDFIDMVLESNRDLVVRRLLECLGRDRTKHQVAEVTSLGLVQMTRKRVGAGLIEVFSENCEHCNGRGIIVSADPIDRPAGDDGGSPNGGGGGGGGKGGSGDTGSGRGTRGRRTRGSGRDTDEPVAPEPKITPGGPTPAQIAAAAHAAPIHAVSHEEPGAPIAVENDLLADLPPDLALGVPVEAAAPEKSTAPRSRRRASRSAKSPAVSVTPVVEPVNGQVDSVVVQPITGITEPAPSFQPLTTPESAAVATEAAAVAEAITIPEVSEVSEASAPAARGRRKRARVVAPAGPPPVGEFDS